MNGRAAPISSRAYPLLKSACSDRVCGGRISAGMEKPKWGTLEGNSSVHTVVGLFLFYFLAGARSSGSWYPSSCWFVLCPDWHSLIRWFSLAGQSRVGCPCTPHPCPLQAWSPMGADSYSPTEKVTSNGSPPLLPELSCTASKCGREATQFQRASGMLLRS